MSNYLWAAAIFLVQGVSWQAFVRWWYRHAIHLASTHDAEGRLRVAARHYRLLFPVLCAWVFGPVVAVVLFFPVRNWFLLAGFVGAIAPSLIWWWRRMASLKALGYGRP